MIEDDMRLIRSRPSGHYPALRLTDSESRKFGLCPNHPTNRLGFCRNGPDCAKDAERILTIR